MNLEWIRSLLKLSSYERGSLDRLMILDLLICVVDVYSCMLYKQLYERMDVYV